VLADIHGAARNPVPLGEEYGLPPIKELRREKRWDFQAALTFVTTPNAPTGRSYTTADLEELCRAQEGVVVLDEAYTDFAPEHALALALKHPHVLVVRTFSKSYALCFQRVGYAVGHPDLVAALLKIKDSYNVNGLGQVAALATLEDLPYYRANIERLIQTRDWLCRALTDLGFIIVPSQTNFIFARPPLVPAETWLAKLRGRKILVRWFSAPDTRGHLRISIGTEEAAQTLVTAAQAIIAEARREQAHA
jgi:histidinol-phosphate aminotransferase